jgi:hypothetical protein
MFWRRAAHVTAPPICGLRSKTNAQLKLAKVEAHKPFSISSIFATFEFRSRHRPTPTPRIDPLTLDQFKSIWLTHQEAELRLVEADSDPVVTVEETEAVAVDVVDLVAEQTRTRRRNGNQSPSSAVLLRRGRSSRWRRSTCTLCQSRSTKSWTSSYQS